MQVHHPYHNSDFTEEEKAAFQKHFEEKLEKLSSGFFLLFIIFKLSQKLRKPPRRFTKFALLTRTISAQRRQL